MRKVVVLIVTFILLLSCNKSENETTEVVTKPQRIVEQFGFKHLATHRLPFDAFYVSILSEKYRGSKFATLRGMFNGLVSYLKSISNIQKTSSLIYVFKLNSNE